MQGIITESCSIRYAVSFFFIVSCIWLFTATDEILRAIDKRKLTDIFLPDMSKAFDSINPRTYTQIHTPTVVQAGWMEPLPEVLIWCSTLNDFTFSGKPLIILTR